MNGEQKSGQCDRTEEQDNTFYKVKKSENHVGGCQHCGHDVMWTITYTELVGEAPEEIEIGTSWQGEEGLELAEDICELMNMAFDAGQESRQETITGLCDRLDRINNLTRPRPAKDPYKTLRDIEEWSGGFAKVPT